MENQEVAPKALVCKLAEIVAEVGYVEKRGDNVAQKYKYMKASDLAHAVRKHLSDKKIFLLSDVIHRETTSRPTASGGTWTFDSVEVLYTFLDGESGEKLCFKMPGTGADTGDKAVYKAITGSLKYALRNAFLVPDDSDPEADEGTDKEAGKQAAAAVAAVKTSQNVHKGASGAVGRAQIPDSHSRIVFAKREIAEDGARYLVSGFLSTIRPEMVEKCFAWPSERPEHKGSYIFIEEYWDAFKTLCQENQIAIVDSASPETGSGAADTPSPSSANTPAAPRLSGYKVIEGQKFIAVTWGQLECTCWDDKLKPWLKLYQGKPAELTLKDGKKGDKTFHNVVGIVHLDGKRFDNEAKKLEIQRQDQ